MEAWHRVCSKCVFEMREHVNMVWTPVFPTNGEHGYSTSMLEMSGLG